MQCQACSCALCLWGLHALSLQPRNPKEQNLSHLVPSYKRGSSRARDTWMFGPLYEQHHHQDHIVGRCVHLASGLPSQLWRCQCEHMNIKLTLSCLTRL